MPQNLCNDLAELRAAIATDDLAAIALLARQNPTLLEEARSRPLLAAARSVTTAQKLLELGFKVDPVSSWWESGIGARRVDPAVGLFLIDHGAKASVHAAASRPH